MFTLIDYHFFDDLSRGILLFLKKYFIFFINIKSLLTKKTNLTKKSKKNGKKRAEGDFFLPLFLRFLPKKRKKDVLHETLFGNLSTQSRTTEKSNCYYSDNSKDCYQQMEASIATTVTALACEYVYQKEDPADYGNSVQNTAPKIAPSRERSVSLGQKHISCLGIDFLFHNFFTLSSDYAEILHL